MEPIKLWFMCVFGALFFVACQQPLDSADESTDDANGEVAEQEVLTEDETGESSDESELRLPSMEEKWLLDPGDYPDLHALAVSYNVSNDNTLLDTLDTNFERSIVLQYLYQFDAEHQPKQAWGLPSCSGYYATYRHAAWANYPIPSGTRFFGGPNCTMVDGGSTGNMCGYDFDNIVSFWLASNFTWDMKRYSIASTLGSVNAYLYVKHLDHKIRSGTRNMRLYTNSWDNTANVYVCLPQQYNASSLRLGWK